MQDEPTPEELTKAVADFLRNDITPQISGHHAFKLRVAINVLDLVTRQLKLEQGSDVAELARLSKLMSMQGSLGELNRVLADQIAKGELDLQTPGLAEPVIGRAFARPVGSQRRGGGAMLLTSPPISADAFPKTPSVPRYNPATP